MKNQTFKAVTGLLFNLMMSLAICFAVGVSSAYAIPMTAATVVMGSFMPTGSLCVGVYSELWTGALIKNLRVGMVASHLDGIPDHSSKVAANNTIHMVDVGGDPEVLVNNTTYPLAAQILTDTDASFSLDKYQTKPTPVTDDELQGISYDKFGSIVERHGENILMTKFKKATHAIAPAQNTAKTPVIATTGATDTDDSRKRMIPDDIIRLKRNLDKLGVPVEGRRLVLCSDHVNDLLATDQKFKEQYNINTTEGKIARLYGFDMYEFGANPIYTSAGVKKAYTATADAGEFQASVYFTPKRMFKATGVTKMYYVNATNDPYNQQSVVNFRHYYVVLPLRTECMGAIYSAKVTTGS
ncbi:MAG: hypothetical protein ACRCUJ_01735 [Phocaeicola sp.]